MLGHINRLYRIGYGISLAMAMTGVQDCIINFMGDFLNNEEVT